MIKAFPGGWDAMAAALGMSKDALENRIYERKGQTVATETSMQMQKFSGTTHFVEAIAQDSGGVFMRLPENDGESDHDELLDKFNELYADLGELSSKFREYVRDDEVTRTERADLQDVGQEIHRTVEELLGLTFRIYCKK
jgi:hypothetical protein